jgi:hypothetical protein
MYSPPRPRSARVLQGLVGSSPAAAQLVAPGTAAAAIYASRDAAGRSLMEALLQRDPATRPGVRAALAHEWFAGME